MHFKTSIPNRGYKERRVYKRALFKGCIIGGIFLNDVTVYLEICREDAIIPTYANEGDSGMDVYAAEDVLIEPGQTVIVPTGIKLAIPKGYEIQVRPRSGISYKTPLRISNSPGTIDSGYRDELG